MNCICIENNYCNTNFTLHEVYEMNKDGVRCDCGNMLCKFSDWDKPREFSIGSIFDFAMCKFQICKRR